MPLPTPDPSTPDSPPAPDKLAYGSLTARAALVNRTHRVVRERAEDLHAQRSHGRSLWLPMGLCAAFVVILCSAIWSLLDQYELNPTGIPDASSQLLVVLLWFLPVSAAILAVALRHRARADREPMP